MNLRNALNSGKQCLLLRMGAQGKWLACVLLLASDKEVLEPGIKVDGMKILNISGEQK